MHLVQQLQPRRAATVRVRGRQRDAQAHVARRQPPSLDTAAVETQRKAHAHLVSVAIGE